MLQHIKENSKHKYKFYLYIKIHRTNFIPEYVRYNFLLIFVVIIISYQFVYSKM